MNTYIESEMPACKAGEHEWVDYGEPCGHGGGVRFTEVCILCGCKKSVDTWAQDSAGEQGLARVSYETLDEADKHLVGFCKREGDDRYLEIVGDDHDALLEFPLADGEEIANADTYGTVYVRLAGALADWQEQWLEDSDAVTSYQLVSAFEYFDWAVTA